MKHTIVLSLTVLTLVFGGCSNGIQNEAEKQAALIQKTMKENSPGTVATSDGGYYMKAKIDGEDWSAKAMMRDDDERSSYKMIHAEGGGDVIKMQLWKRGIEVGKKIPFNEQQPANLFLEDGSMLGGNSGTIEITKIDDQWLEGKFQFTGTTSQSDKKVEVTDGSFRVALVPGLK